MEPWRQYGGFYRMVDFTREWTYTPPPSTPVQGAAAQTAESTQSQPQLQPPAESASSASSQHAHHPIYHIHRHDHEHNRHQHQQHQQHQQQHQQQQQNNQDGSSWACTVPTSLPRNNSVSDVSDSLPGLRLDMDVDVGVEMAGDLHPRRHDPGQSLLLRSPHSTVTSADHEPGTFPRSAERSSLQVKEVVVGRKSLVLVKKWFSSVRGSLGKRRKIKHRWFDDLDRGAGDEMSGRPISMALSLAEEKRPPSVWISPSVGEGEDEVELEYLDGSFGWHRPLDLSEWKAWGYYARPWVGGVFVTNYPPRPDETIPYDINVEAVANSLVDEDGIEHPERWIPGVSHSSLPPRPPRWASDPRPYWPSQCELNPYLRRKIVGAPPLFWDLGKEPATAVHGHSLIATPLLPCDRAQPATWPMTTHLFIGALADDVELRWPILIKNKWGVTVQDVLEWIYINFQQAVDKDEWETWPQFLRDVANISYDKRGQRDCLRRIDYLGFHSMFRGLEQSPDGQSWYLYVGRPY